MEIVFVCSLYSGNIEKNTEYARKICREIVDRGDIPIAPHLLFPQFMSEATEREKAMRMSKTLLARCDRVEVYGKVSSGMWEEIQYAWEIQKDTRHVK